ncbi:CU044_2847 family protein [Micromonospora sp. NPDC005367]|uniref:CU044_2847 family protein n=1 Tax=Micromonospora sp. NPDC005367 TaxID=3155590 RepID=UPI0033B68F5C
MSETELVRFVVRDGTAVIVEVEEERRGSAPVGRRVNGIREAREFFDANLAHIRLAAEAILEDLRRASSPDEIKIGFAVKMTTEVGAVIARSALEGNISVELLWRRADPTEVHRS